MAMFKYDIGGYVLLSGTRPIAQISCGRLAERLPSMLAKERPGESFTIISADGYWTTRIDPVEEETACDETTNRVERDDGRCCNNIYR